MLVLWEVQVMIDAVTVALEVITIRYLLFHKYVVETSACCPASLSAVAALPLALLVSLLQCFKLVKYFCGPSIQVNTKGMTHCCATGHSFHIQLKRACFVLVWAGLWGTSSTLTGTF